MGTWVGGVWNVVVTGVTGAPPSHCSNTGGTPVVNIPQTNVVAEKPYITIDGSGKFSLQVPPVKTKSSGANFDTSGTTTIDFSQVSIDAQTWCNNRVTFVARTSATIMILALVRQYHVSIRSYSV